MTVARPPTETNKVDVCIVYFIIPFMTPSSRPHRGIKGPRVERLLNRTYDASRWFDMTRYRIVT